MMYSIGIWKLGCSAQDHTEVREAKSAATARVSL